MKIISTADLPVSYGGMVSHGKHPSNDTSLPRWKHRYDYSNRTNKEEMSLNDSQRPNPTKTSTYKASSSVKGESS